MTHHASTYSRMASGCRASLPNMAFMHNSAAARQQHLQSCWVAETFTIDASIIRSGCRVNGTLLPGTCRVITRGRLGRPHPAGEQLYVPDRRCPQTRAPGARPAAATLVRLGGTRASCRHSKRTQAQSAATLLLLPRNTITAQYDKGQMQARQQQLGWPHKARSTARARCRRPTHQNPSRPAAPSP